MTNMIKWKRNYQYFYDLTKQRTGHDNFSSRMFWETIEIFCSKYQCLYSPHGKDVTCSAEDFTMIMLTCPEAVEKVHD